MESKEFKVGQIIRHTGLSENQDQLIINIDEYIVYTDSAKFNIDSIYAHKCILIKDVEEKHTIDYCRQNGIVVICDNDEDALNLLKIYKNKNFNGDHFRSRKKYIEILLNTRGISTYDWQDSEDGMYFINKKECTKSIKYSQLILDKEMEKEIVCYELLQDLPNTKAGIKFYKQRNDEWMGTINSIFHWSFNNEEMHDTKWFKPIYKEDEIIKISDYEVKFYKAGGTGYDGGKAIINHTSIDGNLFSQKFWESAKIISEHSKAKIMVGCSKQFDVSLQTINKIIDRLK